MSQQSRPPNTLVIWVVALCFAALVILALFFCLAIAGRLSASWIPSTFGLFGVLVDIGGVIYISLDTLKLAEKVVMTRSDGTAFWAGTPEQEAERQRLVLEARRKEVEEDWRPTRYGLAVIFLGFLLQAIGNIIALGVALR